MISISIAALTGSVGGEPVGVGGESVAEENATVGPRDEHPEDPGGQTVGSHEYAYFEGNVSTRAVEREMYEEVNAIRTGELSEAELELYNLSANLDLGAWGTDAPLASAARAQAAHLARNDYFAHSTPSGKAFSEWYYGDMNRGCGSCYLMQNIAKTGLFVDGMPHENAARTGALNETFARLIVSQFMHSGPHKATLTAPGDAVMGFGVRADGFSLYTTQNVKVRFGEPSGESPVVAEGNDAPAIENRTVSTAENESVTASLDASDPDGDALTVEVVDGPDHGTVRVDAADRVVYTPAPGFSGEDALDVRVSDGDGGTDVATVSVTVSPASRHPSGVSRSVFEAVAGSDGELSREEVLALVQQYVADGEVAGEAVARSDVLAVMRYYTAN